MKVGEAILAPLDKRRVKLTLGKKSTEMDYKDLWGAVFVLGEGKYRDEMLPLRQKEMMVFSRKHVIKVSKDLKAGETVNVWCEVNIPKIVVESIAEKNGAKVIYQQVEEIPLDVV
jgi:hypothetical protein